MSSEAARKAYPIPVEGSLDSMIGTVVAYFQGAQEGFDAGHSAASTRIEAAIAVFNAHPMIDGETAIEMRRALAVGDNRNQENR